MDDKAIIKSWGTVLALFLLIAIVAIGLIMQPVKIQIMDLEIMAPSAITAQGLALRAEAWKVYPEYNLGLGCIAVISFISTLFVAKTMYSIKK